MNPAQGARYFSVFACGEQVKSSPPSAFCAKMTHSPAFLWQIQMMESSSEICVLLSPSRYGFMTPNLGILARGAGEPHLINGSSFMVVGGRTRTTAHAFTTVKKLC